MSPKRMFLLSFLSFGLFFLGPAAIDLSPAWSAEETKVADGGALEGKVVFRGTPPAPRKVIPTQDQQVCGSIRDEPRIVLGKDNTVRGAIVYLKGVEKGKPFEKPSKPPMIDNIKCKFEPEVQVVPIGTELVVHNSDPILHNTHGYLIVDTSKRTVFNHAIPQKGQQFKSLLKQPGLVDVRCDVHGHMQAWILVAENPYYAVTKEDGAFAIKDIPPGKYTLVTFQPHTGTTETPVTVEAKKTNNVTVELKK
jgi:plastocyanin